MKRLLQFLVLTTSLAVGILEAHERSSSIVVFDGDTKIAVANTNPITNATANRTAQIKELPRACMHFASKVQNFQHMHQIKSSAGI